MLNHVKGVMLEDAMFLNLKVAGAIGGQLYDIKIKCAAIIREAARELVICSKNNIEVIVFGILSK